MNIDLNENDMLLATILVLAGAIAAITLKQMEIIGAGAQYQTPQYTSVDYKVQTLSAQHPNTRTTEPSQSPIVYRSPATMMGYNSSDDLVSIARRLPSGEIVRRKIRDPDMSIDDLNVEKWVEFNEYNKETDMTWM